LKDAKIKTSCNYLKRRFMSLFALIILVVSVFFAGVSCIDGVDGNSSDDPFGNRIVVVAVNPDIQSGNGSGDSEIQVLVNPDTVPDGSTVLFELNSPNLRSNLRGCITDADGVIAGSEAFANYLAGINIASSQELQSDEPPVASVNVAATVSPPGENPGSNFDTVLLTPVGIIPPEDIEDLVTNPAGDPTSIFVTLEFQTIGVPPGTTVDFTLSRPDLGSLNPTSTEVAGPVDSGVAATQYTTVNNTGGTQVVTATAVLPNPFDFDPSCPNVPEADRTIQEFVVITQSVPEPTPVPTSTP
jgi:hypothetical protein